MLKIIKFLFLSFVLSFSCSPKLNAQQMGIGLDTELQFAADGYTNFVNLLSLEVDCPVNDHLRVSAASISTFNTRSESLLDDLQGFSNIEADNQLLTLAVAGIGWSPNDRHSFFLGVRNVNEDYFTSDVTSLFINSSCGIFPTIACNMDIANYPLASMGLHYSYSIPKFCLQASVYNGQAYDQWTGRDNLWRVTPHSDGLFMITQGDWQMGAGHYFVGAALHSGPLCKSSGPLDSASPQTALWAYTEQSLTDRLSLIADYSHAFGRGSECTDFVGIGAQYAWSKSTLGLFSDYVRFRNDSEWATELTYKYDLNSILFIQPSIQLIHHGSWMSAGLIRVSVRI